MTKEEFEMALEKAIEKNDDGILIVLPITAPDSKEERIQEALSMTLLAEKMIEKELPMRLIMTNEKGLFAPVMAEVKLLRTRQDYKERFLIMATELSEVKEFYIFG